MRHSAICMLVLFVTTLIVGCGEKEEAANETPKTPEQIAEEVRDNLDCPAEIVTKRAEGSPIDDIQGVRPGLTFDEAHNLVLCLDEKYVSRPGEISYSLNTYVYSDKMRKGFIADFKDRGYIHDSDGQEVRDSDGEYKRESVVPIWDVITLGLPNEERVISVRRTEDFYNNKPTTESTKQALTNKYGKPAAVKVDEYSGEIRLYWAYDTFDRPITETSPLYRECATNFDTSLGKKCGVQIVAVVSAEQENKNLVRALEISIIDSAKGSDFLDQTQRKFDELDAKRRAEELKDAEKNSSSTAL